MNPQWHVEILRGCVKRMEVRIVEHPTIRAGPRYLQPGKVRVLLSPVLQLRDGLRNVPHRGGPYPPKTTTRINTIVAHEPMKGLVQGALEAYVAQRAKAVSRAREDDTDVDSRSFHVPQADCWVPIASGVYPNTGVRRSPLARHSFLRPRITVPLELVGVIDA